MDNVRIVLATLLFSFSCFLVGDLFVAGFSVLIASCSIAVYGIALLVLPGHRQRERSPIEDLFDFLEAVVEIPYRMVAALLRAIGDHW